MKLDELYQVPESFKLLEGKTIKSVHWLSDPDMEVTGWYKRPVRIIFTDGSILIPQSDDEGNNGGAMYYQDEERCATIYTNHK